MVTPPIGVFSFASFLTCGAATHWLLGWGVGAHAKLVGGCCSLRHARGGRRLSGDCTRCPGSRLLQNEVLVLFGTKHLQCRRQSDVDQALRVRIEDLPSLLLIFPRRRKGEKRLDNLEAAEGENAVIDRAQHLGRGTVYALLRIGLLGPSDGHCQHGAISAHHAAIEPARAAQLVVRELEERGHEVHLVDPLDLQLPLLDRMYTEHPAGEAPEKLERLAQLYRSILGSIAGLVFRFRVAESYAVRQQLKWVALGLSGGVWLILVARGGAALSAPASTGMTILWEAMFQLGVIVVALGFLVSLLRYRLFDAETVISRSAAYAVLTIALVATFGGTEAVIQNLGQSYLGMNIGSVSGAMAAAVAAVLLAPS